MTEPRDVDELIETYRAASDQDERRPSPRVRDAVLAHAKVVAQGAARSASSADIGRADVGRAGRGSANWPLWRMTAVAGVAVIGLAVMLILQFERPAPGHDQVASVTRSSPPAAPSAAKTASSPAPSASPVAAETAPAVASAKMADSAHPELSARMSSPAAAPGAARMAGPAVSVPLVVAAPDRPPIFDAAESGNVQLLTELIAAGAQVNARHAMGRTPLMLAAINGKREAVAKLLELGADRSLADQDGLSALDHARRLGWEQIAHELETKPAR